MSELMAIGSPTVLSSRSWVTWNEEAWGLSAEYVQIGGSGSVPPRLEYIYYRDRRGRVRLPPTCPYSAIRLWSASGSTPDQIEHIWIAAADELIEHLRSTRTTHALTLPPGLADGRPFVWSGQSLSVRYTYVMELDSTRLKPHSSVLKRTRKAERLGYRAERSEDWQEIVHCLDATAQRAGFPQLLTLSRLKELAALLDSDVFRGYVVRAPGGNVVSGGVRLHEAGGTAVDWQQGTHAESLSDGVNQLMYSFVIADLESCGAAKFDFGGANIRQVAEAKSRWGAPLAPFLVVTEDSALQFGKRKLLSLGQGGSGLRRSVGSAAQRLAVRAFGASA